ncbi:MAG: hypothetical protein MHM6MM_004474 [Cercozoa sp. M6MM]
MSDTPEHERKPSRSATHSQAQAQSSRVGVRPMMRPFPVPRATRVQLATRTHEVHRTTPSLMSIRSDETRESTSVMSSFAQSSRGTEIKQAETDAEAAQALIDAIRAVGELLAALLRSTSDAAAAVEVGDESLRRALQGHEMRALLSGIDEVRDKDDSGITVVPQTLRDFTSALSVFAQNVMAQTPELQKTLQKHCDQLNQVAIDYAEMIRSDDYRCLVPGTSPDSSQHGLHYTREGRARQLQRLYSTHFAPVHKRLRALLTHIFSETVDSMQAHLQQQDTALRELQERVHKTLDNVPGSDDWGVIQRRTGVQVDSLTVAPSRTLGALTEAIDNATVESALIRVRLCQAVPVPYLEGEEDTLELADEAVAQRVLQASHTEEEHTGGFLSGLTSLIRGEESADSFGNARRERQRRRSQEQRLLSSHRWNTVACVVTTADCMHLFDALDALHVEHPTGQLDKVGKQVDLLISDAAQPLRSLPLAKLVPVPCADRCDLQLCREYVPSRLKALGEWHSSLSSSESERSQQQPRYDKDKVVLEMRFTSSAERLHWLQLLASCSRACHFNPEMAERPDDSESTRTRRSVPEEHSDVDRHEHVESEQRKIEQTPKQRQESEKILPRKTQAPSITEKASNAKSQASSPKHSPPRSKSKPKIRQEEIRREEARVSLRRGETGRRGTRTRREETRREETRREETLREETDRREETGRREETPKETRQEEPRREETHRRGDARRTIAGSRRRPRRLR